MADPATDPQKHAVIVFPDYDEATFEDDRASVGGRVFAQRVAPLPGSHQKPVWSPQGPALEFVDASGRRLHPHWTYRRLSVACELDLETFDDRLVPLT